MTVPTDPQDTTTVTVMVQGKVARAVVAIEGLGISDATNDRDALAALVTAEQLNAAQTDLIEDALREARRARKALWLARSTPSNRAQFERDAEAQMDLAIGLLVRAQEAGQSETSPLRYASGRVVTSRAQALDIVANCELLLTGAPA